MKNASVNMIIKIASLIAMIAMGIISIICFKADVVSLCVFLGFILFYVLLPGLLVIKGIAIELKHKSTELVLSFFIGWALIVLEYFITEIISTNIILYAVGPVLSIAYLIYSYRKNTWTFKSISFSKIPTAFFIFAALVFLYSLLNTQYDYIAPAFSEYTYIGSDKAYHIGIINALVEGYPAENPWVYERTLSYHLFTEMMYAVPVRLFGISSDMVMLACVPYMIGIVFSTSLYSFFVELTSKKERAGLYCLATLGGNMFMMKSFASSYALMHVLSNVNSCCFGICTLFVAIPLLECMNAGEDGKVNINKCWKQLLVILVLIMLATGIKGPISAVFIAGLWGTFILGLLLRKVGVKAAVPIIVISAAFVIVYFGLIGTGGGESSSGESLLSLGEVAEIGFFKSGLIASLKALGLPEIVRKIILFAVFMLFYLTAFLFPYIVGFIREVILVCKGEKPYRIERITVYASSLVGLVAMLLLNYNGHSQVYFGFVTVYLVPIIVFWLFEDLSETKNFWTTLLKIVFAVMLAASSLTIVLYYSQQINSTIRYYEDPGVLASKTYNNITREEYEGMAWIKNNTEHDALIVSDRYYSVSPEGYDFMNRWCNTHFLYAAYSQRNQYLEGSGFSLGEGESWLRKQMIDTNNSMYDVDNPERGKIARKLGADYLVVSKRFDNPGNLENKDFKLCYTNEQIDIYKIKK